MSCPRRLAAALQSLAVVPMVPIIPFAASVGSGRASRRKFGREGGRRPSGAGLLTQQPACAFRLAAGGLGGNGYFAHRNGKTGQVDAVADEIKEPFGGNDTAGQ